MDPSPPRRPPAPPAGAPPRIHRAILVDREVDLVTPLMSQITLEGLVDEVTGIRAGAVPWAPRGAWVGPLALLNGFLPPFLS